MKVMWALLRDSLPADIVKELDQKSKIKQAARLRISQNVELK